MNELGENPGIILQDCLDNLRKKYTNMSILELKKEKLGMVKDLEEINQLLDELINEQVEEEKMEDLQKQIQKNKRLRRGLEKSLINFQFMLTGDYSVKAEDEIKRLRQEVKTTKEEVNKFNRMLAVPMQKDIEICQDLQKQLFRIEKQLQQTKARNSKKKQQIELYTEQNQKKQTSLKQLSKQIFKLKQEFNVEGLLYGKQSQLNFNTYQQLLQKKDKLIGIIEKDEKRLSKEYSERVKRYNQVEEASIEIQHYLKEIEKSISEKMQQLKQAKKQSTITSNNQKKSRSIVSVKRKVYTQHNSQIDLLNKQRQLYKQSMARTRQRSSEAYNSRNSFKTHQNSQQILPKLYKALGKKKFQIQEDCDIRDLLLV